MIIDSTFPGGNIVVEEIRDGSVLLHQDLRDTAGDWFYWYFRVTGAAGRSIRFHFTKSIAIGARGPAYSIDGGKTWQWLGKEAVENNSFVFQFPPDAREALFCMTIPYLEANWAEFVDRHKGSEHFRPGILCSSRKQRPVEMARLGCLQKEPRHRVVLTCRHHCCETTASFVLEGIIDFVLSGDERARKLRETVEFLVIPFMDKDGVEDGDQGKQRRPRDHARDYAGDSIYAETAALRALVPQWSNGKLRVAFDIHCPWILGGINEKLYIVGSPSPSGWEQEQRYAQILEAEQRADLNYRAANNLPFGVDWNTDANFTQGKSMALWLAELPEVKLASAWEIPYANAEGHEMNPASLRAFGGDIALALNTYLEGLESQG